ncbi:MAG: glycerol kinase, partial [Leptospiraceae bacterium]|nr:glycerol kinase [Leptospiraceae bacterium]
MSAEKKFVMSIDSGSTGIRAMLFNRAGEIVERAYQRTDPVTPEPGALEHDPEMLWQSLRSVVSEVLSKQNAA